MDRNEYLNQLAGHTAGDDPITNSDIPIIEYHQPASGTAWAVAGCWHLSPEQNGGNHHVYVDLLDQQGKLLPQPNANHLLYSWEGMRPDETPQPVPFDKQAPEPGTNVPIWLGQVMSVWMQGQPSDTVYNLRTDLPDEGQGNSYGHHSWYVVFQLFDWQQPDTEPPPEQPPTEPEPEPPPTGSGDGEAGHGIYAIHEPGGEGYIRSGGATGWIVFTEALGCDPGDTSGKDFSPWAQSGIEALVRLNNGYEPVGTIPQSDQYGAFAVRCANYVRASRGAHRWIIGNEMNYAVERPYGQVITPDMYAECFTLCREAIKQADPQAEVIVGAVAPWNNQTSYHGNPDGDWVTYLADILRQVQCDGVAIHTYTHGADPGLISSEAKMDPPFAHRRYEFRAYQDFCTVIPPGLPIYITETDENVPWLDQDIGWVQAAYGEIDRWNMGGQSLIHCLALYRWPRIDQWYIDGKQGVIADFQKAIAHGYRVREGVLLASPVPPGTPISQHFGENAEYYSQFTGYAAPLKGHNGVDFACSMNTPITATDDGVVIRAGYDEWGFGLLLMIQHAWGQSLYAHLHNVCVGVGMEVAKGQRIAYSGKSGNATGPHLHFSIRPNNYDPADGWGGYVDPLKWLGEI